ncbi:General secretion pathway protein GspD [Flavobacterium sp. 9AF]|uniref:type II secretion system protein GspD n=1 Tax=Flavobacterium sp. 9AF TaxID=2653142 RepID=UPI0012F1B3D7|nr:type II and III secretion system protein [Flavobacterium sp. 9AF]VXB40786.1 General secretion pathway protein GspD [Flavobacterium sp. 9AF]
MKKNLWIIILFITMHLQAQDSRIQQIQNNIQAVIPNSPGLAQKVNINIKQASLSEFLLAVSEVHKVNLSVAPSFEQIMIVNNFSDVTVSDLLVFLCKEYNLTIEFTGNILALKPYQKPAEIIKEKVIDVKYKLSEDLLTLNLKEDKLYDVFKKITNETGKNIVFTPGLENKLLTAYIVDMPFDDAINKVAFANNLEVEKTKDNFYLFDNLGGEYSVNSNDKNSIGQNKPSKPLRSRKSNFYFVVLDQEKKLLEVDFENTPISNIIYDIGNDLNLDVFISNPLENAGNATLKAKQITFDELLNKIFESKSSVSNGANPNSFSSQNNNSVSNEAILTNDYTYSKKDNIYIFGLKNQLIVRNIKAIALMHRSIEILGDPSKDSGRSVGRLSNNLSSLSSYNSTSNTDTSRNTASYSNSGGNATSGSSILEIFPKEILAGIDVKIDTELNSFIVSGPSENIIRFENFVKYIDKPVPVILIEVMLLEVSRSATIETGISAGIGDKPTTTSGSVFPTADINLGAQTLNKIINRFDGFGSLNIGNVVPNFYLSLKALESNGSVNIRSTPRLSTLNGHRAFLSIGETTYYVVTNQNYYGSQIPQTSEIKNYQPIDAELSLTIKPLISGDGQITMDIKVIQSSFNGQKVDKDAPPGINSREFTSIIRVKDQDLIVLGGLEEKVKNDTGSGVPLLSRIPIIKWFFSSRKREDSKKKLSVIIKPTVIY